MKISNASVILLIASLFSGGCNKDGEERANEQLLIEKQSKELQSLKHDNDEAAKTIQLLNTEVADSKKEVSTLNESLNSVKDELQKIQIALVASQTARNDAEAQKTKEGNQKRPPEFDQFISASRLMIATIQSSPSYNDFQARLVELKAAGSAVTAVISDKSMGGMINDFVDSLSDAQVLWLYQINSSSDFCQLLEVMNGGKASYSFFLVATPSTQQLMSWNSRLNDLVLKYNWSDNLDSVIVKQTQDSRNPWYSLNIVKAISHIFTYSINEFSKIETQSKTAGG